MCVPGRPRGLPAGVQLRRLCRGQALTLSDFQSWSRAFIRLGKARGSFPRSHGGGHPGKPPASPGWPGSCRYQPELNTNESWHLPPTSLNFLLPLPVATTAQDKVPLRPQGDMRHGAEACLGPANWLAFPPGPGAFSWRVGRQWDRHPLLWLSFHFSRCEERVITTLPTF